MSAAADQPRWDGQRLLFNVAVEGGSVRCAISRLALAGISGGKWPKGPELFRRFAALRPTLEAAALAKLRARQSPLLGVLHIWEDDVLEPSPDDAPVAVAMSGASD